MFRQMIVTLSVVFITIPAISSAHERIDLLIKKNTSVLLSALVTPVFEKKGPKDKGVPIYYLNQLHLSSGATIIVDKTSIINAKRIVLKPKSAIRTLGHDITIKTDEYIPEAFEGDVRTLMGIHKKSLMGAIDTRSLNPSGLPGNPGAHGTIGPSGTVIDMNRQKVRLAGVGHPGKQGKRGGRGKSAGSIDMIVKNFGGAYFIAFGGDGGKGGRGGRGGKGGSGYKPVHRHNYIDFINNLGKGFIGGGKGRDGAQGGRGGRGGNGGAITIHYEAKTPNADHLFIYENAGGQSGQGGDGGMFGMGGDPGKVMMRYGGKTTPVFGNRGESGNMGPIGNRGKPGNHGGFPRFERIQYVVEK